MRRFALLIAAIAPFTAAAQTNREILRPLVQDWKACVMAKARQYATTAESVDDVVKAALLACASQRNAVLSKFDEVDLDRAGHSQAIGIIESSISSDAFLAAMEIKSAR